MTLGVWAEVGESVSFTMSPFCWSLRSMGKGRGQGRGRYSYRGSPLAPHQNTEPPITPVPELGRGTRDKGWPQSWADSSTWFKHGEFLISEEERATDFFFPRRQKWMEERRGLLRWARTVPEPHPHSPAGP